MRPDVRRNAAGLVEILARISPYLLPAAGWLALSTLLFYVPPRRIGGKDLAILTFIRFHCFAGVYACWIFALFHQIIASLREEPMSLSSLARIFGVTLKIVEEDVRHIAKSTAHKIEHIPPRCESCGFVFRKREKHRKPSRCPQCKSEHIAEGKIKLTPK